jgi:hypothetical protein
MKPRFTLTVYKNKSFYHQVLLLAMMLFTTGSALALPTIVSIPLIPGTDTTFFTPTNRKSPSSGSRILYTAAEIGMSGSITAIAFQKAMGSTTTAINYINIWMRETSASTVSTVVPPTFTSAYTKVYSSSAIDNSMTSGWTTITLATPFVYAATGNLEIIIEKATTESAATGAGIPVFNCHTTTGPIVAYHFGASAFTTTFTGTTAKRPNIQLSIENTCSGKPAKGTVSGPATRVCSGGSFTLTGTGLTMGTGMHYQWQSRNAGSGAYSNMGVTDTFPTLTTSTTVDKDYRIFSQCLLSAQSDTSTIHTINVLKASSIAAGGDTTFCIGGSVILSNTGATGVSFTWYKDGSTTGITTATYTANSTGVYSVLGTTAACPTGVYSNNKTVTVHPLPTATVTPLSATTFCDGLNVVLDANFGTGLTYQWQKGGTDISGATSVSYTATTAGSYRVKVTNSTTSCSAFSSVTTVTVNPSPAAPVISGAGGKTSYCASSSLVLSTTAVSGVGYQWENTSGDIVGATTTSYTASSPNTFRLIAIMGVCSTKSNALVITENPLPAANINPVGAISFCNGDSIEIKATPVAGASYEWLNGGTAIAGAADAPGYKAKASGVYSVRVKNKTTGCSDESASLTINVISPAVPTVSASSATEFCIGGNVTLNATVGSGLTTQWQESGVDMAGETAVTYTASTSGSYRMKVSNTAGCEAYSDPVAVVVNPLPGTAVTIDGGTSICHGSSSKLTAPIIFGHTYQWKNAGVDIPGETFNPYYAKTAGSYSVVITDSNGCQATSFDVPIAVKFVKSFYVHPYGNTFFCDGDKTMLATQSGYASYQWYLNGTYIPGATDTFVYARKHGKYAVKVQDIVNGCYATSPDFNIIVIPAPDTPFITLGGTRLSTRVTGVTYQWFKNGVLIPGATTYYYDVTELEGIYTVEVTNERDCSKSAAIDLNTTSINNTLVTTGYIKVYPNPVQDVLHIEVPDGISVSLMDLQGRVLYSGKDVKQISMSQFVAGMYVLQFTDANNEIVATEKVSKQN